MMNTTFTENQNTFIPQLPVFQQPQLLIQVPQVIPMPQATTLPPYQLLPNVIPVTTNVKFWDAASQSVVNQVPTNLVPQVFNNQFMAPMGYSFVLMNTTPQMAATVSDSGESMNAQASESRSVSVGSVRSEQFLSQPPTAISRQSTPEPAEPEKTRKYKHRSKQVRIEQVHAEVKEHYTALGLYAAEDEVLRGFDTIRVHVKTFVGLNEIHKPLDKIMSHPRVQVLKIATPFSMKNKFQKKGFIVYLKLASTSQVEIVQSIFAEYAKFFPKCDIALKKEDKLALDARKAAEAAKLEAQIAQEKTREPQFLSQAGVGKFDSWDDAFEDDMIMAPPSMRKQGSLSSVAA